MPFSSIIPVIKRRQKGIKGGIICNLYLCQRLIQFCCFLLFYRKKPPDLCGLNLYYLFKVFLILPVLKNKPSLLKGISNAYHYLFKIERLYQIIRGALFKRLNRRIGI